MATKDRAVEFTTHERFYEEIYVNSVQNNGTFAVGNPSLPDNKIEKLLSTRHSSYERGIWYFI